MLTPKQERFCQNLEVKRMSQREAYIDAYPNAKRSKPSTQDENACRLANDSKILARREELRVEQGAEIAKDAKWTREKAFEALTWLMDKAKQEIENSAEMNSPAVSAIINSTKELNTIYAVAEKQEGGGILDDILNAVRGIDND
jgi:hypothetical protein